MRVLRFYALIVVAYFALGSCAIQRYERKASGADAIKRAVLTTSRNVSR